MDLVQQIIARAKSNKQRIVLPEATEERTLRAADRVLAEDIADLILIGNVDEIHALAEKWGLKNIDKATLVDPESVTVTVAGTETSRKTKRRHLVFGTGRQ